MFARENHKGHHYGSCTASRRQTSCSASCLGCARGRSSSSSSSRRRKLCSLFIIFSYTQAASCRFIFPNGPHTNSCERHHITTCMREAHKWKTSTQHKNLGKKAEREFNFFYYYIFPRKKSCFYGAAELYSARGMWP